jgi:putative endonuclease
VAFVYILRCRDGSLYTGIAKDVAARLRQHQAGRASRYTRARLPVALLWSRRVATWSAALREEHRIKQLRRSDKVALVARSRAARARRSRHRREDPGPGVVR